MTADHNAGSVRGAFARLHAADVRAGKVRSLTACQALFPGFEAEIAAQLPHCR